jgi:hypothetical protein
MGKKKHSTKDNRTQTKDKEDITNPIAISIPNSAACIKLFTCRFIEGKTGSPEHKQLQPAASLFCSNWLPLVHAHPPASPPIAKRHRINPRGHARYRRNKSE